jgi:hypothetical protein
VKFDSKGASPNVGVLQSTRQVNKIALSMANYHILVTMYVAFLVFVFNLQVKNSAEYALSSLSPKLARFRLRLRQRRRLHLRALVT